MVTADIVNSYNREVFAVPGRPGDSQSSGCNTLIRLQRAQLLTSAADLIYMLDWNLKEAVKPIQRQLFVTLDPEEKQIFEVLKEGKEQMDLISLNCQLPTHKVASLLLNMELKRVVRPLPGKCFELV